MPSPPPCQLDNFLLASGRLVLCDFSEALLFDQPRHATLSESRGTEMYQPPEMLMGRPTNACAADCWALGCMLYELLTGRALFPGRSECLRPLMLGQSARTSRPVRWMSGQEEQVLRRALGGAAAGPAGVGTQGQGQVQEAAAMWTGAGAAQLSTMAAGAAAGASGVMAGVAGLEGRAGACAAGRQVADQVLQLLHCMLIEEHKRASVAAVVARGQGVLHAVRRLRAQGG